MKKMLIGFVILFFIFFAISCTRRLPFMLYNDDRTLLVKRFEQILITIKNKDKESLKAMFSKKAIEESKNIDEDITFLFTFFQGDVISWEQHGVSGEEEKNYGKKINKMFF